MINTMNEPVEHKRWYSNDSILSFAVNLFQVLPENLQTVLAKVFIRRAEHDFNVEEVIRQHHFLQTVKAQNLEKAKQRRRKMDENESVFMVLNYLYALENDDQTNMALRIIKAYEALESYLAFCKSQNNEPSINEVEELIEELAATVSS